MAGLAKRRRGMSRSDWRRMNHGIGHKQGPESLEPGQSWRRISWQKARDHCCRNLPDRDRPAEGEAPCAGASGIALQDLCRDPRCLGARCESGFLFSSNGLDGCLDDQGLPPAGARAGAMRRGPTASPRWHPAAGSRPGRGAAGCGLCRPRDRPQLVRDRGHFCGPRCGRAACPATAR